MTLPFVLPLLLLAYLGIGSLIMILVAYVNAVTGGKPWFNPDRKDRWSWDGEMLFPPMGVIALWPLFIVIMLAVCVGVAYMRMVERAGAAVIRAGEAHHKRLRGGVS